MPAAGNHYRTVRQLVHWVDIYIWYSGYTTAHTLHIRPIRYMVRQLNEYLSGKY